MKSVPPRGSGWVRKLNPSATTSYPPAMMEIFQRLNREQGITLVLVTHETDIAEYADRVIVFKDGKIKKDYPVQNPRNAAEELKNLPAVEEDEDEE